MGKLFMNVYVIRTSMTCVYLAWLLFDSSHRVGDPSFVRLLILCFTRFKYLDFRRSLNWSLLLRKFTLNVIHFRCNIQFSNFWNTDWTFEVRFPVRTREFFLLSSFQTETGAHRVSHSVGTRDSFPRVKWSASWSWPLVSISYRGQDGGYIPSLPHTFSWCIA
jgi:hypothetical protein